jgi:hypothetical protein
MGSGSCSLAHTHPLHHLHTEHWLAAEQMDWLAAEQMDWLAAGQCLLSLAPTG